MIKYLALHLIATACFLNSTAFGFSDVEEEKYMINYSINSDFQKSLSLKYSESESNHTNFLQRSSKNPEQISELNYSGYRNVQGSKSNANKSNSKKFAAVAIGVIVTGVALVGVTIGAIINAL